MRYGAKFRNCNIYPSYEEILQYKYKCRVQELSVRDTIAKVSLQNLLDHTTKQIVSLQQEVILCVIESANDNKFICEIIFSYGYDGSSSHAVYKKKFDSPGVKSDNSLFATAVIPLRLVASNNLILWNNQAPQSIRFCRPVKLECMKEPKEHVLKEKNEIDQQIEKLSDFEM